MTIADDLGRRVERLESLQAIAELPSRYAMALDARDLDALVALFVDDVHVGPGKRGRDAMRAWYDVVLRRFYRSIHWIGGQQVDLIDADHAVGSVYCRAEHEDGAGWFVIAMRYEDAYERRDGQWFFARRREHPWYSVDVGDKPNERLMTWPPDVSHRSLMPHRMPTWNAFWQSGDPAEASRLSRNP